MLVFIGFILFLLAATFYQSKRRKH
ncbi:LPXTG cell wall anchor domain-containing protein [Brevibacillus sp. SYSU BS000544]